MTKENVVVAVEEPSKVPGRTSNCLSAKRACGPASHPTTTSAMAGSFLFFRAQKYLVIFGGLYLALIVLLTIPYFQSQYAYGSLSQGGSLTDLIYLLPSALYLNAVKIPLFADFDTPEKYGLARASVKNLRLQFVA